MLDGILDLQGEVASVLACLQEESGIALPNWKAQQLS